MPMSGNREREYQTISLQGSRDHGADVLPLRKEFGDLKLNQANRMKEPERENAKLKRLVAELSMEKQILKGVAS